jgi:hypothetical protein
MLDTTGLYGFGWLVGWWVANANLEIHQFLTADSEGDWNGVSSDPSDGKTTVWGQVFALVSVGGGGGRVYYQTRRGLDSSLVKK